VPLAISQSANTPDSAGTAAPLQQAAEELVGEVFYGTLLRQLRDSGFRGPYGHGGRGEEIFRGQLDTVLAARAGSAGGNRLTEALVARFTDRARALAAYREANTVERDAVMIRQSWQGDDQA
jgi:hypothetical protein